MSTIAAASKVLDQDELRSRVAELGEAISHDYQGRNPMFVVMMKGSVVFAADLVRTVGIPSEVDFMGLHRYGRGGRIGIAMDTATPVLDRHVIVVEDIIDTGLTLAVLKRMIEDRGAASVATVALFDKIPRRINNVPIEYRGFEVGDEYLVGYGLDWQGKYRNLASVWAILDMEVFVEDPLILHRHLISA